MDEADLKRVIESALTPLRAEIAESRRHAERLATETRLELKGEIAETRLHAERIAEETRVELRREIANIAGETRVELRREIADIAEETRRHFDVVAEGLNHKIELVAEGVMTVNDRVDRLRDEMKEEFTDLRATLAALPRR